MPGNCDEQGAPRWLLYDALRHRYFTLSETAVALLKHWQSGKAVDEYREHLASIDIPLDTCEIEAFIDFLIFNNLILARSDTANQKIYQQYQAGNKNFWLWLLHNYLFIKIPLFKPDKWLDRWIATLDRLISPAVSALIIAIGMLGIVMVIRQWDEFAATFIYFFNTKGLLFYGLALLLVKSAHELGHAFSAKRKGCKVASIGIAFMVMLPVLYTDTTDAWKLRSRSSRLRIVTAGIRVELYLALLATFLWNILPDGILRSVTFFIATTSWFTSILINISPFLRFDGYYAFSDLLNIENLQQRSFAMGRWQLRKMLWGLNDPLPEPLTLHRAHILIGYAWVTWIYRFFLFLGIAFLVYQFFFKVLGIVLFTVEIIWFIGLPIVKELAVWRERRKEFTFSRRRLVVCALMLALLVGFMVQRQGHVYLPAVVVTDQEQTLFATEVAVIDNIYVHHGSEVVEGEILAILYSDDLILQLQQLEQKMAMVTISLNRRASSLKEKNRQAINEQLLQRLQEKKEGVQSRIDHLVIKAPFSGRIHMSERLHTGRWVNPDMALFSLVDDNELVVEGFVSEHQLSFIAEGQSGVFMAHRGDGANLSVVIDNIAMGAIHSLPYPELGSTYSGNIAIRKAEGGRLIPEEGHYRVRMTIKGDIPEEFDSRLPGTVTVEGKSHNWLWSQLEYMLAILIRESGF